ncbi:MAG: glycosyltransferase family 39 protein [Bacteroidetes bacterium]|nr:glycosyltransferase family 39 protein [Bacteroidota bacterium]
MKPRKTIELLRSWLPAAGLLAVTVIRFLFISSNDVAMDEPFTVFFAQADFHTLFGVLSQGNNPPLFFILMHYWVSWFGIGPLSIRFLPCIFSILTAVMLYKTGKNFFSDRVGFFAAALFTLSDYHQLFAHEARMYSFFALLTVVSMYFFLALTSRTKKTRYMLLLALANVLLIYSHFFGFFIFLIQGLSVVIIPAYRKTALKFYLGSMALCMVAYIPYFPIFFHRFFQSAASGTWVQPPVISDLYTMVWRYLNAPVVTVAVLCILAAALVQFIVGVMKGSSGWNSRNLTVVIWFAVPYLFMFLVSFYTPMFLDRYTVYISAGFYLLAAIALNSLVQRTKPSLIMMSCFIITMAFTFHPHVDNKRHLKEAVSYISRHKGPRTSVIICPQWFEYGFSYHYDQRIFRDYRRMRLLLNQDGIYPVNNISLLDTNKIKTADQVLLFEEWSSLTDPGHTLFNFLNREFRFQKTTSFYENFKVHQYIK